jgi:hypothetical protein
MKVTVVVLVNKGACCVNIDAEPFASLPAVV